tara:strand:- start:2613 stop:3188 length:576 start_codon:yes stop_codon:yes gene_type:complete
MESSDFLPLFIPLLLFYLLFAFPDSFLDISLTVWGRIISVFLIIYYTNIHKYFGLIICLCVIFYYQMDFVEGMSRYQQSNLLSPYLAEPEIPKGTFMRYDQPTNPPLYYKKPEKLSVLLEDENKKIIDINCCPKTGTCRMNIVDKINIHEDLVYPKTDENWAYQVWNQWFISDDSENKGLGESSLMYQFVK